MAYPADRGKFGYAESSGVFYSEYEPTRLLYHTYFRGPAGENPSLLYNGPVSINNSYRVTNYDIGSHILYSDSFPHSIASRNIFWYDYDAYQQNKLSLPSIGGSGINVLSSGVTAFFRKYPILWSYSDLTSSGQFTRFFTKSLGLPFSDISLPSGDRPLSVTIPTLYIVSGSVPRDISNSELAIMPFYQMADVIWQCHNHIDGMYRNPKINAAHPCGEDWINPESSASSQTATLKSRVATETYVISGVPIPQLTKEYGLQFNNLTLKATGFIGPQNHLLYASGQIPGSGYMPYLQMAEQCCFENIRDHNFITKVTNSSPVVPPTFNQVSGIGDWGYSSLGLSSGIFLDTAKIVGSNKILPNGVVKQWLLATEIPDSDILTSCVRAKFFGGLGNSSFDIVCSGSQPTISLNATTHFLRTDPVFLTQTITTETTPIKLIPILYTQVKIEHNAPVTVGGSICTMGDATGLRFGVANTNKANRLGVSVSGSTFYSIANAMFSKLGDPISPSILHNIQQHPFRHNTQSFFGTPVTLVINNKIFWAIARSVEPTGTTTGTARTFTELTIPPNTMVLNPSSIYIKINGIDVPCSRLDGINIPGSSIFDVFQYSASP
jgi:hypothetical protein